MTSPHAHPKRFYKTAAPEPLGDGWTIALDGRTIKTPARAALVLPTLGLAEALAAEWNAQGEHIDLAAMYLTHRAKTGADRPRDEHVEVERMCSSPMFRPARNPHPSLTWPCSSHYPNPPLSPSRTCPLDPPL